jgi:hypothetical protein
MDDQSDSPPASELPAIARWRYDDETQQDQVFRDSGEFHSAVLVRYGTFTAYIHTNLSTGKGTVELHDHTTVRLAQRTFRDVRDVGYIPMMARQSR